MSQLRKGTFAMQLLPELRQCVRSPRTRRRWAVQGPSPCANPLRCQAATTPPGPGLPKDWTQVLPWAQQRFKDVAGEANGRPDAQVSLVQACMLIALEEEAAVEMHPELREVLMAQTGLRIPSRAGAATWSLSRLDSLASQVHDLLMAPPGQTRPDQPQQRPDRPQPEQLRQQLEQVQLDQPQPEQPQQRLDQPQSGQQQSVSQQNFDTQLQPPHTQQSKLSKDAAAAGTSAHPPLLVPPQQPAVGQMLDELTDPADVAWQGPEEPHGMQSSSMQACEAGGSAGACSPAEMFAAEPMRVLDAINTVLFDWHGYGPCNRYGNPRDSHLSSVMEGGLGCSPALSILYVEVAARLGVRLSALPLEEGRYWLLRPTDQPLIRPQTTTLGQQQQEQQETRHHQQENGEVQQTSVGSMVTQSPGSQGSDGCEAASGQGTEPQLLIQGQLQEQQQQPSPDAMSQKQQGFDSPCQVQGRGHPNGHATALVGDGGSGRLLIDPYGQGSLLTEEEVCELFDVTPEGLSRPASRRYLLSCLLADLRDAYWARAVGCSPAPAVMLPLSLETAVGNRVAGACNDHAMGRALAAAEKITWLMPDDSQHQVRLALLHYHARHWDDAWLELGLYLERQGAGTVSRKSTGVEESNDLHLAAVLLEKIRLRLMLTAT